MALIKRHDRGFFCNKLLEILRHIPNIWSMLILSPLAGRHVRQVQRVVALSARDFETYTSSLEYVDTIACSWAAGEMSSESGSCSSEGEGCDLLEL